MDIKFHFDQTSQMDEGNHETTFHESHTGLPKMVDSYFVFKGDLNNPFLAPRGVWKIKDKLIVSDTGQNRVFIWNNIPKNEFQAPDIILGQTEFNDTGRNAGSAISASTLQYPSGIWSDGIRLIIADAWNHRVLIWNSFPTQNGQMADAVVGQKDFNSNLPNISGIGSNPTAFSLNWPYGVFSDGKSLWIADTGNRRVLFYENIPTSNYQHANEVIGKPSFDERDYENHEPIWPYSVRVSKNGELSIADTQFFRNLIWKNHKLSKQTNADIIIGQADFDASGQNQFSLSPLQNSLNWTYDSFFYKSGIFIADTGNSRILWYKTIPQKNAEMADNLIGHFTFHRGSENAETKFGTELQMYWPFSICVYSEQLVVADTGNHRILIFDLNSEI